MDVVRGQNSTTRSVRLQPQNMEDESRDMTQTGKMKSNECSLRSGCAGMVKVSEFSSQIPLLQTTRRDKPQCRGTICNVFRSGRRLFRKVLLRNSFC